MVIFLGETVPNLVAARRQIEFFEQLLRMSPVGFQVAQGWVRFRPARTVHGETLSPDGFLQGANISQNLAQQFQGV